MCYNINIYALSEVSKIGQNQVSPKTYPLQRI